jgi:hypothetical protein
MRSPYALKNRVIGALRTGKVRANRRITRVSR